MPLSEAICRICGVPDLQEFREFTDLWRVTSDCKPFPPGGRLAICMSCGAVQKLTDARWQDEIKSVYDNYAPYFQSNGVEQAVFDAARGIPRRRSAVILERLQKVHHLGETGCLVDVGCGNGVLLSAFAEMHSGWTLAGHDLGRLHEAALAAIPGFQALYTCDLGALPGTYDLATMIHALEHFIDPLDGLVALSKKLKPRGELFIQVPNGAATPFDLVITDHVSHFTRHDLALLLERAGLRTRVLSNEWVTKELSVLAAPGNAARRRPTRERPETTRLFVQNQLAWIRSVANGAREAARSPGAFGLFGTSIAALWLFGQIGDDVDYFVDEDPSRTGMELFGRPVLRPDQVPPGSLIYLALIPPVAREVARRLRRPGVTYCPPGDSARQPAS